MNEPLGSIILPVYNVEKFIPDCIESLINQKSDFDYEIIFVNDGSTDNSEKVIKNYIDNQDKMSIIAKKNGGVSSARNAGLDKAVGQYVYFMDPDDYLAPNCFEDLFNILDKDKPDIFEFQYKKVEETSKFCKSDSKTPVLIKSNQYIESGVCEKIFKRSLLVDNSIYFNEQVKYSEDILFSNTVSLYAKKIEFSDAVLYFYRTRRGSAAAEKHTKEKIYKRLMDFITISYVWYDLYKKTTDERIRKRVYRLYRVNVTSAMFCFATHNFDNINVNEFLNILKKKNLYPFKPIMAMLKPNVDIKTTLINWMNFGFFFEPYFRLINKVIPKFK